MKELDFINIIKNYADNDLIGDDCAHLKDLGIVVTQDNFIEDVHFKTNWATPFQIGYKAAAVNISDVLASGAKPEYLTVGLSLPNNIDENFIKEFYRGIQAGSYGAKIAGGDITGADKICISITAIGSCKDRKISSRSHAGEGYVIISYGDFGLSSKGLKDLILGEKNTPAIKAHLEPELNPVFSEIIASNIKKDYAMMDTSDGLADALFKIAEASNCTIKTSFIEGMFGAEDYNLVAAVPEEFLKILDLNRIEYKTLGKVCKNEGCKLQIDSKKYSDYDELELYNHFSEGK